MEQCGMNQQIRNVMSLSQTIIMRQHVCLIFVYNHLNNIQNEKAKVWVAAEPAPSDEEKNVSDAELGRRVGVSEQQIGKYVNQHAYPSFLRLHQIAAALGLLVKDLFAPID